MAAGEGRLSSSARGAKVASAHKDAHKEGFVNGLGVATTVAIGIAIALYFEPGIPPAERLTTLVVWPTLIGGIVELYRRAFARRVDN